MTMIRIPKGSFWMGDESGLADSDEKPRHQVTLAEDFFLGDREVTVRQFKEFKSKVANDPKCKAEAEIAKDWTLDEEVSPEEDCPVQSVSWFEAVAFCNWLSRNESALTPCYKLTKGDADWECVLDPQANGYRLPSEAQWEYACRAKSHLQYAFGDAERLLGEYAWYDTNSSGRTQPAGVKLPNGWGLFDMHGNVWEWCEDVYHDNYQGAPTDGSAWLGEGGHRVYRGGGWANHARDCRCACRNHGGPGNRNVDLGFRLVLAARVKEDIRPSS